MITHGGAGSTMQARDVRRERSTSRYRRARRAFLARNPYCETCRAKGVVMPSAEVDHIVALADGGSFWDESNWQQLCEICHDEKTPQENTARHVAEILGRAAWRERVDQLTGAD